MCGQRSANMINTKELKRFSQKLRAYAANVGDDNAKALTELTGDQIEYLIIHRLKDNMRFVLMTECERGLTPISYSDQRQHINYVELLMNRYSQIYKHCMLVEVDA